MKDFRPAYTVANLALAQSSSYPIAYDFCRWATDYLYKQYEVAARPTVFRNRRDCYHHRPGGSHQIVYGYSAVTAIYLLGYVEYTSIAGVWSSTDNHEGLRGVWQVVLHEFAHVLQGENKGRRRGSVHNDSFIESLQELIILFPFQELWEAHTAAKYPR